MFKDTLIAVCSHLPMAERKVTALTVDNGSGMRKAGVPGDDAPCAIFPSIVGRPTMTGNQKHSFVGRDAEQANPTLAVDNGSDMCKAGHSGGCAPHAVFPMVGSPKMTGIMVGVDQTYDVTGDEAQCKSVIVTKKYPTEFRKGSGMCNAGFAHDVPRALPPPTVGRQKCQATRLA